MGVPSRAMVLGVLAGAVAAGCWVGPQIVGFRAAPNVPWPSDLPRRHLVLDGERVAICEAGDGTPDIILISGLAASMNDWLGVLPRLAQRHRVVALDPLGFGASARPPAFGPASAPADVDAQVQQGVYGPGRVSVAANAALIPRLLDALGSRRAVLVGLSMGGQIVAWHASSAAADPRVVGVVLIAPSGLGQAVPDATLDRIAGQREAVVRQVTFAAQWQVWWADVLGRDLTAGPVRTFTGGLDPPAVDPRRGVVPRVAQLQRLGFVQTARSTGAEDFVAAVVDAAVSIRRSPMADRLAAIRVPVLVIGGAADRVVPPRFADAYAAGIPAVRYVRITDCEHLPPVECPGATADAIAGFVADLPTWGPGTSRPAAPEERAMTCAGGAAAAGR